jgi:hypothetical protein
MPRVRSKRAYGGVDDLHNCAYSRFAEGKQIGRTYGEYAHTQETMEFDVGLYYFLQRGLMGGRKEGQMDR